MAAIERHMARHAEILRPKFELVLDALTRELTGCGSWSKPLGGYFICYPRPQGLRKARRQAVRKRRHYPHPRGRAFPGGNDPEDSVIRIAPTYPPLEELAKVMELFPVAVKWP